MNGGKHKQSQMIFKQIIAFLSAFEVKSEISAPVNILQMLILTLNNLGCSYKRYAVTFMIDKL